MPAEPNPSFQQQYLLEGIGSGLQLKMSCLPAAKTAASVNSAPSSGIHLAKAIEIRPDCILDSRKQDGLKGSPGAKT